MAGTLVIALPEVSAGASADTHWWLVSDESIGPHRVDSDWLARAAQPGTRVVGLAPTAAVRLLFDRQERAGSTPRQAASIARFEALESSLGDRETLHAVSERVTADGPVATAVAANAAILEWIDWARRFGAELDHIVPIAAHVATGDGWSAGTVGTDHFLVGPEGAAPNEPALAEAILGSDPVRELSEDEVRGALLSAAERPVPDLRTGRFAKTRRFVLDRDRIRELVALASLIPLLTLLWAVASIAKLNSETEALDRESLEVAQAALGRPVTLENAEAELAQRGGGGPGLSVPLAALNQALQREGAVASTQIGYGAGGTFSATLAAPSHNDINRLLLALQRDGYRVTAVPRQSPDGRTMVDLTMRVGP